MSTKKAKRDAAKAWWGGNTLWLGPWKAAEVLPMWYGTHRERAPDGWKAVVGACWESDGASSCHNAMTHAEGVVFGQLLAIGIRAVVFTRPDGSLRRMEQP